jgi:catechol 2,3-dioxygenase-like lactoylglutathione lyase family enzyme
MNRVVGIDHLSIRVSDLKASREFYGALFEFLGFKKPEDYGDAVGWSNGKTMFWIRQADAKGKKHKHRIGDVGFHHYAFELRSRKDVDELQAFLEKSGATIVDPADEYYDDYYAVFFLDPDGLKLEGMKYGEKTKGKAKAPAACAAKRMQFVLIRKMLFPSKFILQRVGSRAETTTARFASRRSFLRVGLACTRFHRHRVRCFDGTGGVSWSDGSLRGSLSLRLCG